MSPFRDFVLVLLSASGRLCLLVRLGFPSQVDPWMFSILLVMVYSRISYCYPSSDLASQFNLPDGGYILDETEDSGMFAPLVYPVTGAFTDIGELLSFFQGNDDSSIHPACMSRRWFENGMEKEDCPPEVVKWANWFELVKPF